MLLFARAKKIGSLVSCRLRIDPFANVMANEAFSFSFAKRRQLAESLVRRVPQLFLADPKFRRGLSERQSAVTVLLVGH